VLLRAVDLTDYQDSDYSRRYLECVTGALQAEAVARTAPHRFEVTASVVDSLHKLMAYKDEYEVARLLTTSGFEQRVAGMFSGRVRMRYNLQPPLARTLGLRGKLRVGGWMRPVLRALAAFKFLRGTAFDPFGALASRRDERELIAWYDGVLRQGLALLDAQNAPLVAELLALPMSIRGYESVKSAAAVEAKAQADRLLLQLKQPRTIPIQPVLLAA
jgi:indolepyruvate ferredoxin oxidoreductase